MPITPISLAARTDTGIVQTRRARLTARNLLDAVQRLHIDNNTLPRGRRMYCSAVAKLVGKLLRAYYGTTNHYQWRPALCCCSYPYLLDVRPQLIMPPQSTAPIASVFKVLCNRSPGPSPMCSDEVHELFVFFGAPQTCRTFASRRLALCSA